MNHLCFRHIADHRNPQLLLNQRCQSITDSLRYSVHNDPPDHLIRIHIHKSPNQCHHRKTHPPAIDHKKHRCLCLNRKFITAALKGNTAQTIIVSHNAFDQSKICRCIHTRLSHQPSRPIGCCKKGVQISGWDSKDKTMKHRIDIIRSAFERHRMSLTS